MTDFIGLSPFRPSASYAKLSLSEPSASYAKLSMVELHKKLQIDKFAKYNKTLLVVYQDNLKENINIEYIAFLYRYIPYYRNTTMKDLGLF